MCTIISFCLCYSFKHEKKSWSVFFVQQLPPSESQILLQRNLPHLQWHASVFILTCEHLKHETQLIRIYVVFYFVVALQLKRPLLLWDSDFCPSPAAGFHSSLESDDEIWATFQLFILTCSNRIERWNSRLYVLAVNKHKDCSSCLEQVGRVFQETLLRHLCPVVSARLVGPAFIAAGCCKWEMTHECGLCRLCFWSWKIILLRDIMKPDRWSLSHVSQRM